MRNDNNIQAELPSGITLPNMLAIEEAVFEASNYDLSGMIHFRKPNLVWIIQKDDMPENIEQVFTNAVANAVELIIPESPRVPNPLIALNGESILDMNPSDLNTIFKHLLLQTYSDDNGNFIADNFKIDPGKLPSGRS